MMSPAQAGFSRYRDPANGYESDYIPEQTYHRFPGKFTEDDPNSGYFSAATAPGRSQHYAEDSDQKSRVFAGAGRSRTASSSAKRSRKTSSSTARELVRALINERLEADTTGEVQLARAYDIIKTESRRAADAERIALESTERLKGLAIARAREQKDAVRAQAELRAYKMQLDNAQKQLEEANAIVAASDAERMRAEHAVTRMKKTVEKFREGELARRAREQGFREGRREALWSMGVDFPPVHSTHSRSSPRTRGPIYEDDDDDEVPHTPTSNVPLPVPPPESVPVMSRRAATPTFRRSTPIQQDWRTAPIPEVIRQEMTPPSRRASTPGWGLPVPPPASIPTLPRRGETPRPSSRRSGTPGPRQAPPPLEYGDFEPVPDPRAQHPEPDHIIIRSPVPVRPEPETPTGIPAQVYPTRPASSQATPPPPHAGHPQGHHPHDPHRHPRHHSMGDPAALATASADRIYSQYATSSESSSSEPRRPPSRGMRRHGLPQQEIIVPRPAQGPNHRFEPPIRPPSATDSVPASAAALARQRNRRPTSVSSSSTTSSARTETTGFPVPSRVARLQRQSLGERKWSAESGSSIPGITIEPPSRPESVDTVQTGMTRHSHLLPDGMPVMHADQTSSPGWGVQQPHHPHQPHHAHSHSHSHHQPQMQPQRPPSRTGFMYGPPPSPGNNTTGGGPSHPPMGFGAPASPGMSGPPIDFGAPPPPGMQPFPGMGMGGHMPPVTPVTSPEHERPGPGSAADYFADDHHRGGGRQSLGRRQARHRREPAGMGMGVGMESVEDLVHARGMGMGDLNAFHDPGTDPSLDEEEEAFGAGRERSMTPRARTRTFSQSHSQGTGASTGPYAFDERRAAFDERRRSGSIVGGSRSTTPASGVGFVPPRPSSRASGSGSGAGVGMGMGPGGMGMYEDVGQGGPASGFDTPRRIPLPYSSSATASRAASSKSGGRNNRRGRGGRGETSILHGGISGRDAEGRSLERTPFGNTPFVRSSGLDED